MKITYHGDLWRMKHFDRGECECCHSLLSSLISGFLWRNHNSSKVKSRSNTPNVFQTQIVLWRSRLSQQICLPGLCYEDNEQFLEMIQLNVSQFVKKHASKNPPFDSWPIIFSLSSMTGACRTMFGSVTVSGVLDQ